MEEDWLTDDAMLLEDTELVPAEDISDGAVWLSERDCVIVWEGDRLEDRMWLPEDELLPTGG